MNCRIVNHQQWPVCQACITFEADAIFSVCLKSIQYLLIFVPFKADAVFSLTM